MSIYSKSVKTSVKIIVLGAFISIVSAAEATPFFSFYAGAMGGYSNLQDKYSIDCYSKSIIPPATYTSQTKLDLTNNGVSGDIFLGVRHSFRKLPINIRLEGEAELNSNKIKSSSSIPPVPPEKTQLPSINITQQQTYNVGISFLPGIYTENNLLYTRIGYRVSNWQSNADHGASYVARIESNDGILGVPGKHNNILQGISLGVGFESIFFKGLSLRMEYDYTHYQNLKSHYNIAYKSNPLNTAPNEFRDYNYSSDVNTNQILMGIAYYFGSKMRDRNKFFDPVAWLQGDFSHSVATDHPNEDQTLLASNSDSISSRGSTSSVAILDKKHSRQPSSA